MAVGRSPTRDAQRQRLGIYRTHEPGDHTSRWKLTVRLGGGRPEAAVLASGRRPGIPESGFRDYRRRRRVARVDPDAAGLLAEIRRQRHTGQSRIVAALDARGALDPGLDSSEAADMVYALLSPDGHRILTVERGWTADRHKRWIARTPSTLLRTAHQPPASTDKAAEPGSPGSAAAKRNR